MNAHDQMRAVLSGLIEPNEQRLRLRGNPTCWMCRQKPHTSDCLVASAERALEADDATPSTRASWRLGETWSALRADLNNNTGFGAGLPSSLVDYHKPDIEAAMRVALFGEEERERA
jgi:hypothetical protein